MANSQNEKVKRGYFKWLRGARGYSEKTIVAIERAIHFFEESTGYQDFKKFCERQATAFKKWLDERRTQGKALSNATKYHNLRHLNAFFTWLATQPGYKSQISLDSVSYLSLDRRTVREVLAPRPQKYPSLEQVKQIVKSIEIKTVIDKRDQALISFMLLSGMRYTAICTLSLGCFDTEKLVIHQDPRRGVQTKGGKLITTCLLKLDEELIDIVVNWLNYLKLDKKYGPCDPLFPRTKVVQEGSGYSFIANDIETGFWSGSNSIREIVKNRSAMAGIPYFHPHSFRHAACQLGLKLCRTPEELKALSQNLGHEQVTTTLRSYGTLDNERVSEVMNRINSYKTDNNNKESIPIADLEDFIKNIKK